MRYFDDFATPAPLPLAGGALLAFTELDKILGFDLMLSKSKRGRILEFLGLIVGLPAISACPPLFFLSD